MSLPQPVSPQAVDQGVGQLFEVAQQLRRERRWQQALPILAHLATFNPGRLEVRTAYVAALAEGGRTLEAIAQLNALKAYGLTPELIGLVRSQSEAAVTLFNGCLQRGDVAGAERVAAALADLMPQNPAMLNAALGCNRTLGRTDEALRYAGALAMLEPQNRAARVAYADLLHANGDIAGEIDHRVALALAPEADGHPLIALRDLHDAAGLILCRPLTPASRAQLDQLLAAARAMQILTDPGSEAEAWLGHYQSLIAALDLDMALAPAKARDAGPVEMLGSDGAKLDWKGLKARADKLGAECVFFAAADEAYVDLYARWFALSVRRHADTPFLAVIHVIGGKGALKRIAETVGVSDERLVFMACDFDPAAATVKIHDAPPKDWSAKPVAHLQSMRFLRLGKLLKALKRPVFVSDIDLLLQRGVADLLAAHAHEDVVLNENEATFNAGSRLTANLLLVQPTQGGLDFAAALAAYLTDRLAQPSVTRWIDQVGLTLARLNLQANSPAAKIGYFDTRVDINNLMYPSYQDNPYRFFSLFHGFDTSSLEDGKILGEGPGIAASAA